MRPPARAGWSRFGEIGLWSASFAAIVALHAGAAIWLLLREPPIAPESSEAAPVLLDLSPPPAASGAAGAVKPDEANDTDADEQPSPEDTPPDPQMDPPPEPPIPEPSVELPPETAAPAIVPDAVTAPTPVEAIRPPPVVPPEPAIVLPAAAPKPVLREPKPIAEPRPQPKTPVKRPQRPRDTEAPPPRREARRASASAGSRASAPQAAASASGATSVASLASWRAQVAAHLQRFKRYPADAQARGERGTARITFVMDRGGRVLSVSLTGGSGSPALDQASVEMVRRAQPLPPPPPDVGGGRFPFSVPVSYSVR